MNEAVTNVEPNSLVSVIPPSPAITATKSSPRGVKRSRSPDESEDSPFGGADDGT